MGNSQCRQPTHGRTRAYRLYVSGMPLNKGNKLIHELLTASASKTSHRRIPPSTDPFERLDLDALRNGNDARKLCQRIYDLAHARVPSASKPNQAAAWGEDGAGAAARHAWSGLLTSTGVSSAAPATPTGSLVVIAPGPRGAAEAAGDVNAALAPLAACGYAATWLDTAAAATSEADAAAAEALAAALRRQGGTFRPLAWVLAARRRGLSWAQAMGELPPPDAADELDTFARATNGGAECVTLVRPPRSSAPSQEHRGGNTFADLLRRCAAPSQRFAASSPSAGPSAHEAWPIVVQLRRQSRATEGGGAKGGSPWAQLCAALGSSADDTAMERQDASAPNPTHAEAATPCRLFEACCERIVAAQLAFVCGGMPCAAVASLGDAASGEDGALSQASGMRAALATPLSCASVLACRGSAGADAWLNGAAETAADIVHALAAACEAVPSDVAPVAMLRDLGVWVDHGSQVAGQMEKQMAWLVDLADRTAEAAVTSNASTVPPDVFTMLPAPSAVGEARAALRGADEARIVRPLTTGTPTPDVGKAQLRKARACALQISLRFIMALQPSASPMAPAKELRRASKQFCECLSIWTPPGYETKLLYGSIADAWRQADAAARGRPSSKWVPKFLEKELECDLDMQQNETAAAAEEKPRAPAAQEAAAEASAGGTSAAAPSVPPSSAPEAGTAAGAAAAQPAQTQSAELGRQVSSRALFGNRNRAPVLRRTASRRRDATAPATTGTAGTADACGVLRAANGASQPSATGPAAAAPAGQFGDWMRPANAASQPPLGASQPSAMGPWQAAADMPDSVFATPAPQAVEAPTPPTHPRRRSLLAQFEGAPKVVMHVVNETPMRLAG